MSSDAQQIAFVGAGRMASAIVRGLLATNRFEAAQLRCISAADGTGEQLAQSTGIRLCADGHSLMSGATALVLACKPQQLATIDPAVIAHADGVAVFSILAGTPIARLRQRFPNAATIIRAMPNTPGQIGAGVTAYAFESNPSPAIASLAQILFEALGTALEMPESLLDAVTGVSGSGPAYVFEFIAALRDAAIAHGIPATAALTLARETVAGAAALLRAVPESPETHRQWVSSPGGTTLAGLAVLDAANFRALLAQTVDAATQRSRELAQLD